MPKNGKKTDSNQNAGNLDKAILKELALIRKLLVLLTVKLGSDSPEISTALRIPQRTLRDWVSFGGIGRSNGWTDNKEGGEMTQISKKLNKAKKRVSNKIKIETNPVGIEPTEDKLTKPIEVGATELTEENTTRLTEENK